MFSPFRRKGVVFTLQTKGFYNRVRDRYYPGKLFLPYKLKAFTTDAIVEYAKEKLFLPYKLKAFTTQRNV